MIKLFVTSLFMLLLFCGNVFSQNNNKIIWTQIHNKGLCYIGTDKQRTKDKAKIASFLKRHTKNFMKQWKIFHSELGRNTNKKIFENLEVFVVPEYEIIKITDTDIYYKLSRKCIADIIFIYNNYYLGNYSLSDIRGQYNKYNYQKITGRFTNYQIDKDLLLDFFAKDFEIFSIQNFSESNKKVSSFWFTTNEYAKPLMFDKNIVWSEIEKFNNKSIYKSKFYEHAND